MRTRAHSASQSTSQNRFTTGLKPGALRLDPVAEERCRRVVGARAHRRAVDTRLVRGDAVGELVDTRRLDTSFSAIDYFERAGLPFVMAVNCFDDARTYPAETVRAALSLGPDVPVLLCDARHRESVKEVLVHAVEHVLAVEMRRGGITG